MARRKKCLIIGGGGFVGSWVTKNLITKGIDVTIIDSQENYFAVDKELFSKVQEFRKSLQKGSTYFTGKFQDFGEEILKKENFSYVIHLAARACEQSIGTNIANMQVTEDINLVYQLILLIKKYSPKTKIIFMSSSAVYGDYDYAITEEGNISPQSIYGVAKAAGEFMVKQYAENWNIIRSNAAYGFGDLGDRATHAIALKAFSRESAWVNDAVWSDFIYVKDLADGIVQVALSNCSGEIFHISGGTPHTILEYAKALKEYFPKFKYSLKSVHDRPKRGVLDNSKAKMLLGWSANFSLAEGMNDYMEYVKKNKFI